MFRSLAASVALLAGLTFITTGPEPADAEEFAVVDMSDTLAALASDDYTTRVEATKALARSGAAAIDAVKSAAAHDDPEVAWRVRMILVDIGITGDEAAHQKVVATFGELSAAGNASFDNLGEQIARWREIRGLPAEQQIFQLNAFIRGGGIVDPIFFGRLRGC